MEFYRQEYWTRVPFPSPGDLPDPGIECISLMSPALAGRFFFFFFLPLVPPGKPNTSYKVTGTAAFVAAAGRELKQTWGSVGTELTKCGKRPTWSIFKKHRVDRCIAIYGA